MQKIQIKDHDDILDIRYEELVHYHGKSFIGGVALALQLLNFGFERLVPGDIPCRQDLTVKLGVNGPGIIDGVEMVTRARTRGALCVDPIWGSRSDAPDAADGLGGKYLFEISWQTERICFALLPGLLPDEFIALDDDRDLVRQGIITADDLFEAQEALLAEQDDDDENGEPAPLSFADSDALQAELIAAAIAAAGPVRW